MKAVYVHLETKDKIERSHAIVEERREHYSKMINMFNVEASKTNVVITAYDKSQENV